MKISYRKKHLKKKLPRKSKKTLLKSYYFWFSFLGLLIILWGLYFLLFSDYFQIHNILIEGSKNIVLEDLKSFIFKKTNIHFLNIGRELISSQSIFLVKDSRLKQEILRNFILIKKVEIKKNFPDTIKIIISEREPSFKFCHFPLPEQEQCFLIDDEGVVFSEFPNPLFQKENLLTIYDPNLSLKMPLGQKIIEDDIIRSATELQRILKEKFDLKLIEMKLVNELRADIKTEEGWKIIFKPQISEINSQLTKLVILLESEIKKEDRKKLQYIDVRFKDRAQIMPADLIK